MPIPNNDETRLKAFRDLLIAELYRIPTPAETQQFLTGDPRTRQQIVRECRRRARPLITMIRELDFYKDV